MSKLFNLLMFVCLVAICFANDESDICSGELETGRCLAYMPRYGFDSVAKECVRFIYGGCGGNNNRFDSKEACEVACIH